MIMLILIYSHKNEMLLIYHSYRTFRHKKIEISSCINKFDFIEKQMEIDYIKQLDSTEISTESVNIQILDNFGIIKMQNL